MLKQDIEKITQGVYPFHMPGHKRQEKWLQGLLSADITEVDGADDLHNPCGIIAEAQNTASKLYKTISTIFLTGGSTCGILAAISALCSRGDGIIIGRNCHKSVYNACLINELNVNYVYPTPKLRLGAYGEVLPSDIAAAMDKSGAKVVVITSPTYEGIVSNIKTISQVVHKKGGTLIIDGAHGAHLGLNCNFAESARNLGADIVVESAHKTLPCLTGAAMLHICSHRVCYGEIQNRLGIFETSSPSYPIMASLDRAVTHLAKEDLFTPYVKNLNRLYAAAEEFKHLSLFRCADFDMGKIVIFCGDSNISGFELKTTLREKYKIQLEMAMPQYALAMTSVADTHEGFDRLISALREIDSTLTPCKNPPLLFPPKACAKLPIFTKGKETYITPENAVNKISAEFIYAYPPGSPIVAPGEVITKDILDYLWSLCSAGAQICSSKGKYPNEMAVFQ